MNERVPADRVISQLVAKLAEAERQNAILRVQVEMATEAIRAMQPPEA